MKVSSRSESRAAFENRPANFFDDARINRRFEYHDRALPHHLSHRLTGDLDRRQVRHIGGIDRRWHGNQIGVVPRHGLERVDECHTDLRQGAVVDLAAAIVPGAQFDQAAVIVVVTGDRAASLSQSDCQRQANIAKPDDGNAF